MPEPANHATPAQPAPALTQLPSAAPAAPPKLSRRQLKIEAKLAKNYVPGNGPVVSTAKDVKKVLLRASVYVKGGGQPYEEDVKADDMGTFTLKGSSLTYSISPGSVIRTLDGMLRVNVREDQPLTININSLEGENIMHPMVLNGIVKNNLWNQFQSWANRQGLWKQASTWGMIGIGLGLLGALIWQIKTTGNGLNDIADALENFRNAGSASGGTTDSAGATHNPIAPGGN